jgi:peptide/nickel transport system permease protein
MRARRATWRRPSAGQLALLVVLSVALLGRLIAPDSPDSTVGVPLAGPSATHLLGTDYLGRDVLSRVLYGGFSVVATAGVATAIEAVLGVTVGLLAGFKGGTLDAILMRTLDVVIAFPPILFVLVIATGAGHSVTAMVLATAVVLFPATARVVRGATLELVGRGYVEAAVARGESLWYILRREILPNCSGIVLADLGIRLTYAILLTATVAFFGLGIQPPSPNWAVEIADNRDTLTAQPLAVLAPAALIAALTISVNLASDSAVARRRTRRRHS